MSAYNIKIEEIDNYKIDENGNRENNPVSAYCIVDESNNRVSNYYSYIEKYNGSLFIVSKYYYGKKFVSKDGIVEIENNIERPVVPLIYDRIIYNNDTTATAYANNDHMTYIDLNKNSAYYGMQLVPAILNHAAPFDKEYKGYAECSINNVVGYLPRTIIPRDTISVDDLLTEIEVQYILNANDLRIYENAIKKMNELKRTLKK